MSLSCVIKRINTISHMRVNRLNIFAVIKKSKKKKKKKKIKELEKYAIFVESTN